MDIQRWSEQSTVKAALHHLSDYTPVLRTAIAIQQIPAPTFDEGERAALVQERMRAIGLQDVQRDAVGNVYGRRPGSAKMLALLIAAHIDTVFPRDTDLTVRYEGDRVYGPGLGDNSVGVAGMLHLAQVMQQYDLPNQGDIWFVGNVGEEGLGDLRGMRAAIERLQHQLGAAIALEGCDFGSLHHQAIGVRRYRISVTAVGGHSWGDFGNPSAIHVLVRLANRLTEIMPPRKPRTTYNIGVIEGGTSINSIAQNANLLLDMRSVDLRELNRLVRQVDTLIEATRTENPGVQITTDLVGDRPAGAIPRTHPLVQAATNAYRLVGARVAYQQGSTDANIPLSRGIPAVCMGLTDGGNAHRQDEYIKPANLGRGTQALLLLTMAASSFAQRD